MARALWTGAISFGLVTIPVRLHSAVERREELSFHFLHKKDGSRIDYKRFCAAEDVEVPWGEIVKGYEYQRDKFVVLTDADFARARVDATQTICASRMKFARPQRWSSPGVAAMRRRNWPSPTSSSRRWQLPGTRKTTGTRTPTS